MAHSLERSIESVCRALRLPAGWAASSLAFAAYFDLLVGGQHGFEDHSSEAEAWLRADAASQAGGLGALPRPLISTLDEAHHSAAELARLNRWWDLEPDNAMALRGCGEDTFQRASRHIGRALDLLREAAPELSGEIACIVERIVLARPEASAKLDFSGASSFALWGAVAINPLAHSGWPDYLKTLVHESAHLLLFAIAREQPLVENDPALRYPSPLRADPRPMDGIFHAAFVSAREAFALDACLAHLSANPGACEPEARNALEALLSASVLAFDDCRCVIEREGALTPLGREVLDDAIRYVESSFSIVGAEA